MKIVDVLEFNAFLKEHNAVPASPVFRQNGEFTQTLFVVGNQIVARRSTNQYVDFYEIEENFNG